MLLYKDNRFHGYGVSFPIPDNFKFDCKNDALQNGITVQSIDGTFNVQYQIYVNHFADIAEPFHLNDRDEDFEPLTPLYPIIINGMPGYHLSYMSGRSTNHDYALVVSSDPEHYTILTLSIWSGCGRDIDEILDLPEVKSILAELLPEEYTEWEEDKHIRTDWD